MPKVLILSDSHGLTNELFTIKSRHGREVDYMLHCGDSELDANAKELDSFLKVKGNCDFDSHFSEEIDFSVDGLTFFGVHGHLHKVKSSLIPLSYRAQEVGAQVVCFGHTRMAGAEKVGDQLFINPGSIRLPRGRNEKTYAIVTWKESNDVTVDFFDLEGNLVEDLSIHVSFN